MFRREKRKSKQVKTEDRENKQWAKEYILDPLTAPEPSQECGPGSTFIAPSRRSLEQSISDAYLLGDRRPNIQRRSSMSTRPTHLPLSSPSVPSRLSFEDVRPCTESRYPNEPAQRPLFLLSRSNSSASSAPRRESNAKSHHHQQHSPQPLAHQSRSFGKYPPRTSVTRSHSANQLDANANANSNSKSKSSFPTEASAPPSPMATPNEASTPPPPTAAPGPSRSRSNSISYDIPPEVTSRPRRRSSLSQRYPGDMSHRPLDMLLRRNKTADKAPHLIAPIACPTNEPELSSNNPFAHPKDKRKSIKKGFTDTIDRLDHTSVGGSYHHGGPYDAALAGRNTNPKYAPLEAVKDSNTEALKATPKDRIVDCLTHHVPLHGTAMNPPSIPDPRTGEVLKYEEGVDVMRDPHAIGGAYKRWSGVQYLDEDLKGKGEPAYTIEKKLKEARRMQKNRSYPPQTHGNNNNNSNNTSVYEAQPTPSSSAIKRSGSMRNSQKQKQKHDIPDVGVGVGVSGRRRSNINTTTIATDHHDNARRRSTGTSGNSHYRESRSSSRGGGGMDRRQQKDTSGGEDRRSRSNKGGDGGGGGGGGGVFGFGEGLRRRLGSLRWKD